jgi:POT family proton-dependent oligopeptide transporter
MLPIGIACANSAGLVNPAWVVAYYFFQCIGELFISPIGYAMIGFLVPSRLQGIMMGTLLMYCGVGATLASYCSNFIIRDQISTQALLTNANYSQSFFILGLSSIVCAFGLTILTPRLRRLIEGRKNSSFEEVEFCT